MIFNARKSDFLVSAVIVVVSLSVADAAMSQKQFQETMKLFRTTCVPKSGVSIELVEGIHKGNWPEVKELKCYTQCVGQMSGTLNKKGDVIEAKAKTQIDIILPVELKEAGLANLATCKDIGKNYKDPCDKTFYTSKCFYDRDPANFFYP